MGRIRDGGIGFLLRDYVLVNWRLALDNLILAIGVLEIIDLSF